MGDSSTNAVLQVVRTAIYLAVVSCSSAFAQSLLPPPASLQDRAQWKERAGSWVIDPQGHAVQGLSGVLLSTATVPAEFSITIKLRYDELRFFARSPFSGIAFHVQDAKNYDALVLNQDECQLAWKQVRNGLEKVVAESEEGLYTEVGGPFFLRLAVKAGVLHGDLSLDGVKWRTVLEKPISEADARGRAGLVAGAPATWFSWGKDAAMPFPRYVPYVYRTERIEPAKALHAPDKGDYRTALQEMSKKPLVAGDSLQEQGLSSVRAWQLTHDEIWKQRAMTAAHKMVAGYTRSGSLPLGFSSFYQEMVTLQVALGEHWLKPEEAAVVPAIASGALLHGQFERGPMNRALGNMVGIKPALELAPGFPQREQAEKIVKLVENDFAEYGYAPIEDASDYSKVSLIFASIHALESRPDWWLQKNFHNAFLSFAAEISPLGRFPGFGDDDDADPIELMGLMELAHAKWGDPIFREAARRLWSISLTHGVPSAVKSSEITSVTLAAQYASEIPGGAPLVEAPVTVYARANGEPSKAVFRNGDSWMMVDLFAGGEHGHNDSLAVTTLESGGEVQLEDNGRYARGTMFHNRPQFTEHVDDFPLPRDLTEQTRRIRQQYFIPGEWTHYHLPLHDHWIWGNFAGEIGLPVMQREANNPDIPVQFTYNPAKQTVFVLDIRGSGMGQVSLSDLKISSPTGARRLELKVPAGAPPAEVKRSAHDGQDALVWTGRFGAQNLFLGGIAEGSTDAAHARDTWLDFWLKVEPQEDSRVEINSIVIGDRDGYPKRFLDANNPNGETKVHLSEVVDGGGHLVATEDIISQSGTPVEFERDIFQALPGFTWIRDKTRDGGAPGTAGVVWYGVQPHASDTEDFAFSTGLRLKILEASQTGIDTRRTYGMRDQEIAFGSTALRKNEAKTIDSLLFTDKSTWHKVNVGAGAEVWSDGRHWVGRNPDGHALKFDGFKTSRKLFVLTNR